MYVAQVYFLIVTVSSTATDFTNDKQLRKQIFDFNKFVILFFCITDTKYSNLDKFKMLNSLIPEINPKVKELACAILQLEQSIELHYLIPPLGKMIHGILCSLYSFTTRVIFIYSLFS